jgi:VWFA-related protein
MKCFAVVVFLGIALLALKSSAAERVHIASRPLKTNAAHPRASIRTTSSLVLVPVSVLGITEAPVRGLPQTAFRVYEEGVEREIHSFAEDEGPVSIGIVFDASGSMETRIGRSREAIARLFELRMPGDEYFAVAFNNKPFLTCGLTSAADDVRESLNSLIAKGWTALYDAVYLSAGIVRKAANPRRALLVLSDGEDNFSRYTSEEVRNHLRETAVTVYGIGLAGNGLGGYKTRALRRLTEDTGGWFRTIDGIDELGAAIADLSRAIRSQYIIGIQPNDESQGGKYRRIRVKVEQRGPEPYRVSWRSGYYGIE